MGKNKVKEPMASSTLPLINFESLVVVITYAFVVAITGYIGQNLWETITGTSTSLLVI